MPKDIDETMESVEFPHRLFPLTLRINKGGVSRIKQFITQDGEYINVNSYPDQHRTCITVGSSENVEETIDLYFNDFHCEYSLFGYYTSKLARSRSAIINKDKRSEEPPYSDWMTWILDGAHNELENSTRINPYTKEKLPYFEETEHDEYMKLMLDKLKNFKQQLEE